MKGKELEVKNLLEKGKTEQQVGSVLCRFLFPAKTREIKYLTRYKGFGLQFSLILMLFVAYENADKWSLKGEMQKAGKSQGIEAL